MAFIFGAPGLAKSPEELARQREVQQALTAKLLGHTPQNVGEGLSAIGQALAIRGMRSRNEKAAEKGAESREAAMNPLIAAITGGGYFPPAPKEAPDYTPGAVTSAPLADPASERVSKAFGPIGDSQEAFVSSLMPAAMEASKRTGVDPRIIIAQAAQETGWGKHAPGNNFFGIKSHGQAGGNNLATTEYVDGKPQTQMAAFRAYDSPSDSVSGYADFLLANPRYKPMMQAQGLDAQIAALGQSGYATDPNYANSVGAIARSIDLPGQGVQAPAQVAQNGSMDAATLPAMAGGTADVIQSGQKQNLLPLLIKASQNPWLTESQRGIVGALLKNELAKNDPTNALDVEYKRAQIEKMKAEAAKANNPLAQNKFGLNPQYGVDENGNPVILQLGSNGVAVETKLPEDVQLSKAPIKLDAGTEWILLDPITRQPVGRVAKNLGEAEAAKAQGKVQGEARASLPGDILNVQQAIKSIDELSANPGLDSIVGSADQFRPSWLLGPQGNDALARLDQLKGKTFLQAYTTLKGGGQITEVEGQKAENAIARLTRAQDEKTFRQALADLRDVIVKGQKTMLEKAGIPQDQWSRYLGTSVPAQPGPATINGYTIEEVQ